MSPRASEPTSCGPSDTRSGLLDERVEELLILARLGMPLDADREALAGILERLERPVGRPGRLDEALAHAARCLMMVRRHVGAPTDDRAQSRALLDLHGVDGELARSLLVVVAAHRLGKVLDEIASARDVQELEAAADREGRQVALECRLQERQLACVAARLRRVRLGMSVGAVLRRVDVRAAGEHDSVERVERLLDVLLGGRNDERTPTRPFDRIDVRERYEHGREVPDAPARVLRVRRDPDHRPRRAHPASTLTPNGHSAMSPALVGVKPHRPK